MIRKVQSKRLVVSGRGSGAPMRRDSRLEFGQGSHEARMRHGLAFLIRSCSHGQHRAGRLPDDLARQVVQELRLIQRKPTGDRQERRHALAPLAEDDAVRGIALIENDGGLVLGVDQHDVRPKFVLKERSVGLYELRRPVVQRRRLRLHEPLLFADDGLVVARKHYVEQLEKLEADRKIRAVVDLARQRVVHAAKDGAALAIVLLGREEPTLTFVTMLARKLL